MALADRLVVVEDGRVVQERHPGRASPRRPRTDYVARLVGLNLYRGHADGHLVRVGGLTLTAVDSVAGEAFVAFPPAAVAPHPARPDGSPRNTWQATVAGVQRHGDNLRVQLDGPAARRRRRHPGRRRAAPAGSGPGGVGGGQGRRDPRVPGGSLTCR